MGKGLAIFGLILIIVGILPLIMMMIGFDQFASFFYMLYIFQIDLGGFVVSEIMLIFI